MANDIKVTISADASKLLAELKKSGVELTGFKDKTESTTGPASTFSSSVMGMATQLGALYVAQQAASWLTNFASASYDAALAQKDAQNALTSVVGGTTQYADAIQQITTATRGTMSETEAARTAFGLLDNGIAKSAEEAAKYALAGRAMNTALGETASYEKFLMLLDEGSSMLLNNFNITQSSVQARQAEIMALGGVSEAEARLTAIRQLALEKGLALSQTISDESLARQQATASYANFQTAFGGLVSAVEQGLGVMEGATWAFDQMAAGAQAYQWMLTIPATLDAVSVSQAKLAAQNALTATSQEELNRIGEAARANWPAFNAALQEGTGSYEEYQAVLEKLKPQLSGIEQSTGRSKEAYMAQRVAVDAAANSLRLQTEAARMAGLAQYELAAATQAAAEAATEQANTEREAAMARYVGSTNREQEGLGAWRTASGNQPELLFDFQATQAEIDKVNFDKVTGAARDSASDTSDAFQGAFDTIRSAVESQLTPSLDEVWKPPEAGTENIDEAARRLATVSTSGFSSEWLTSLNTQFAGMDFWAPITEAMQSGDGAALQAAANDILSNNVTALWDIELVKENVKKQLQEQNAKQQIMDTIMAELTAEGVVGAQAGIEGASAAAGAGMLGQMMGDPAVVGAGITTGLTPAIDGLKQSLAGLGGAAGAAGAAAGEAGAAAGEGAAAGSGSAFGALIADSAVLSTALAATLPGSVTVLQGSLTTGVTEMVLQLGLVDTALLLNATNMGLLTTAGQNTADLIKSGMSSAANVIGSKLVTAINKATEAFIKMTTAAREAAAASNSAGATAPGGTRWNNGYAGGRASGGAVSSNSLYLVGERGPEMFIPGSNGYIAPFREAAPVAVAASGGGGGGGSLVIQNLVLNGIQDVPKLFDELNKVARTKGLQFQTVR